MIFPVKIPSERVGKKNELSETLQFELDLLKSSNPLFERRMSGEEFEHGGS